MREFFIAFCASHPELELRVELSGSTTGVVLEQKAEAALELAFTVLQQCDALGGCCDTDCPVSRFAELSPSEVTALFSSGAGLLYEASG